MVVLVTFPGWLWHSNTWSLDGGAMWGKLGVASLEEIRQGGSLGESEDMKIYTFCFLLAVQDGSPQLPVLVGLPTLHNYYGL